MHPETATIVGVGLDLIDPHRLGRMLDHGAATFRGHVFTAEEWTDCQQRTDRVHALAERFAVKEACLKALGSGWAEGLTLSDVSFHEEPGGRTYRVDLTGAAEVRAQQMSVAAVHVTIARVDDSAAAIVILTAE